MIKFFVRGLISLEKTGYVSKAIYSPLFVNHEIRKKMVEDCFRTSFRYNISMILSLMYTTRIFDDHSIFIGQTHILFSFKMLSLLSSHELDDKNDSYTTKRQKQSY